MKVTAITPNNFKAVCVDSGILPEAALTEELPDGWFWMRDASGEWKAANDGGDTLERITDDCVAVVTEGVSTGFYARNDEGEWEQI